MADQVRPQEERGVYWLAPDGLFYLRGDGSLERIDMDDEVRDRMGQFIHAHSTGGLGEPEAPSAKSASESKTIKTSNILTSVSAVVALLPEVLGFLIEVFGDPAAAKALEGLIPDRYRIPFAIILAVVSEHYRQLRYKTTRPVVKE